MINRMKLKKTRKMNLTMDSIVGVKSIGCLEKGMKLMRKWRLPKRKEKTKEK